MENTNINTQIAGESTSFIGENEVCQVLKTALIDAAKELADGDSGSAETKLKEVAEHIILAVRSERKQCFEIIQAYKNPVICHRLCLAIVEATCKYPSFRNLNFFDQFDAIIPQLNIDVSLTELFDAWGSGSIDDFICVVSRDVSFMKFLYERGCWSICRKVGLATLEHCHSRTISCRRKITNFVFPGLRHQAYVKNALSFFMPESISKISSVEDFAGALSDVLRELTPTRNQKKSTISFEDRESIGQIWQEATNAALLLTHDLLSKTLNEEIDPTLSLTLLSVIDYLASIGLLNRLAQEDQENDHSVVTAFGAHYLMDGSDNFLEDNSFGIDRLAGGIMFYSLANAAYKVLGIDQSLFLKKMAEGWQSGSACEAVLAFKGSDAYDEINDHFFSQMQSWYIDTIVNSGEGASHIALGWIDKPAGHFMWGIVDQTPFEWQMKVINTGCGNRRHDQKPAPSGSGVVYALSKTIHGTGLDKLRSYLTSATQFVRVGALYKHVAQTGANADDEKVRDNVALAANYDGVAGDSAIDTIYGKGQRSITCVTKCFKAIIRCEDSENYKDFHLISKMLAYTTWHKRLEALELDHDLEVQFLQSLAKKLFFKLVESGATSELLESIAHYLITDDSWMFKCVPIMKSVYTSHLQSNNNVQAAAWLKYIFVLNSSLGLQCTAEVIDDHVDGRRSFEVAVDALKLLAKPANNSSKTYARLEKRCLQLSKFSWETLRGRHYKLLKRIVKQMSLSKKDVSIYKTLQNLLSAQTNQPSKREANEDWPTGIRKVRFLEADSA
ncbi:MAG: hypothetical protein Q8K75_04620 [Chlamydiales bacterium]|nr:hypothetical protein [Chlamydiales bacterium]